MEVMFLEEKDITQVKIDENCKIHQVLHLAVDMGETLLKNGAEIFRVEETIAHVCNHYEIETLDCFILSNGIFVTAEDNDTKVFAKVKHVPLSSTHSK